MVGAIENKRQCYFCRHFEKEIDVAFVFYRCQKGNFLQATNVAGYPNKRAETCADFELDTRSKPLYTSLPSDSSSLLA